MVHIPDTARFDGLPVSVTILGVRVDRVTQHQVLAAIERMISLFRTGDSQAQSPPSCQQVVTVNPEFVMAAQHNPLFLQCINQAELVMADGIGIVLAARYLHKPVPERVTGVDTLIALAQLCAERGYRVYLLGAAPGIAEQAATRLQVLAPGLQIAGSYAGSPAEAEEADILERIRVSNADLLYVAYGAPAQDLWIQRNLERLPVAVAMGVGGSFDFLAGKQRRAPRWMQHMGLEWLYRLYREPWRWRRMLALPQFALRVIVKGQKS